jgi:putrescine transport system substrate-binding protein
MAVQDPGNRFAVPFMWGTTGIGMNVGKILKLDPSAPIDSWNLVYEPKEVAKFASCGVSIVDSPNDVVAGALLAEGKNPNSASAEELELAERKLLAIRPYVRKIDGDSQISDLATNDICLMVTWTSNVVQARRRATEVGNRTDFRFVIPKEGTVTFVDALAVPKDAPHSQSALLFVDFLMRPDIAARSANFLGNASANKDAVAQIEQLQREDTSIYPGPDTRKRLQPLLERSDDSSRIVTRLWTRFKTGQ